MIEDPKNHSIGFAGLYKRDELLSKLNLDGYKLTSTLYNKELARYNEELDRYNADLPFYNGDPE